MKLCPYKPTCQKGILEPKDCIEYKSCELYQLLMKRQYPMTFSDSDYNRLETILRGVRKKLGKNLAKLISRKK